jgi:hypothetical protein
LTRRSFLRLAGWGLAGAIIAACAPPPAPAPANPVVETVVELAPTEVVPQVIEEIASVVVKGTSEGAADPTAPASASPVAGYMLIWTVLADADLENVTDPREELAKAITGLEYAEYAIVVSGPMQVIVPIVADSREEVAGVFDTIMAEDATNQYISEARLVYANTFHAFDGTSSVPTPREINADAEEIELKERSIAYVFVNTESEQASEFAAYASDPALKIADASHSDKTALTFTDDNGELIGVRWAAVLEDPVLVARPDEDPVELLASNGGWPGGRVLVHLRTFDNDHLGRALAGIRRTPYVRNDVAAQTAVYSGGNLTDKARNGPP